MARLQLTVGRLNKPTNTSERHSQPSSYFSWTWLIDTYADKEITANTSEADKKLITRATRWKQQHLKRN